ncbi:hypothetical protein [Rufibacter quisquiliarum]|uniref:Spy/CpxP family protein refolding chaperone n=1 Tax=Rufibacter quisquiliarum TaxID=1549639 RepID=A0A839GHI1_9BACT|nr:hypothetical protein [Rufibacter quisquiliarum]MBA9076159.1 Spy/CpxP family protein refolding chaperone [Rufibacter quisquiliarum]
MKTLKNLTSAALLAVALLFGSTAFAQQGPGEGRAKLTLEERVQAQTSRFQKQLDLTPDQTTKVQAIILASAQEIDKMRAAGKPNREAMVALNQKRTDDIKAILTPAQKEKFEQQQNSMRERAGNGQSQAPGPEKAKKDGKKKKGGAETEG